MTRRLVILCLMGMGFLNPVSSSAESVYDAHTEVELVSFVKAIKPGMEFWSAIRFKTDPEWHVYWMNPGDSGMAPDIQWQLPAGVAAGEIRWPYPKLISQPPLASYGYEEEVFLSAPITVPLEAAQSGSFLLKARVRWLACKVECIPGQADLKLEAPFSTDQEVADERWREVFNTMRESWPLVLEVGRVQAVVDGARMMLDVDVKQKKPSAQLHFFPKNPSLIQHAQPQRLSPTQTGYRLEIPLSVNWPKSLERIEGVLVSDQPWLHEGNRKALWISVPLEKKALDLNVWTALGFAFIGGLILNLMPCVLPVLSLKILSFVKHSSENPRALFMHGLVFGGGVVLSFWALAAVLLLLRAAGHQIGWGFQLQSPIFLAGLALIFLIFALNLFGLFEISFSGAGAVDRLVRRGGYGGSFFGGLFATVVATPCTAPFMGSALGFTLTQSAWVAFAVFTALGVGMAFPYILFSLQPKLIKRIPKPGPWMVVLRKVLAIPLLATSAWLGWVLWLQIFTPSAKTESAGIAWQEYSENRLNDLRARGEAVFIDFTAAWCLTCQVNDRVALRHPDVVEIFTKNKITPLKADWTSQNQEISRALSRFGRNSIPLYIYYPAGHERAYKTLPEILTPSLVLKELSGE